VYAEWRARGAHFLTPPKHHQYEIRCYIRDPDGCIIEVGRPPTRTATGRPISGSPPAYSGAAACAGTLVGAYLSAATTARHVADAVEWGADLITGRPTLLYWQLTVTTASVATMPSPSSHRASAGTRAPRRAASSITIELA
jgi:hypothetical protein